jgi:hypothetical protein
MTLRKIISNSASVKNIIRQYKIQTHLFFGKYDSVIPASIGKKFQRGLEEYITLNILESGHRMTQEKTLKEIFSIIQAQKNDSKS